MTRWSCTGTQSLHTHLAQCSAERKTWTTIRYRAAQVMHKATGRRLTDQCSLTFPPVTRALLEGLREAVLIGGPLVQLVNSADVTRLQAFGFRLQSLHLPADCAVIRGHDGVSADNMALLFQQLCWRAVDVTAQVYMKYYPSGRLRSRTVLVSSFVVHDEVLPGPALGLEPLDQEQEPFMWPDINLSST